MIYYTIKINNKSKKYKSGEDYKTDKNSIKYKKKFLSSI